SRTTAWRSPNRWRAPWRCRWVGTPPACATRASATGRWPSGSHTSTAGQRTRTLPAPRMGERDPQHGRPQLRRGLGPERVDWSDAALREHARDTWPLALLREHQQRLDSRPACVVRPTSTAEVAEVLRYANREIVPVVPFGGGSGVCGGVLPSADAI